MKVAIHRPAANTGFGGAPRNYQDIWSEALRSGHDIHAHDLFQEDASTIRQSLARLSHSDTLICNAGPVAHLYHFLRQDLNAEFRIIRDVRTAFWSPYLLQEAACAQYLRPSDVLVTPSRYAAQVYEQVFPHLVTQNVRVCYPLRYGFSAPVRRHRQSAKRCFGYLGRISEDKNCFEMLEFLERNSKWCSAVIAGPLYPYSPRIAKRLGRVLSANHNIRYLGILERAQLSAFFEKIDVLLFPAASSNETFGRVLAEARHAEVPIVAADFGPTRELVPSENLFHVRSKNIVAKSLFQPFSFATPDRDTLDMKAFDASLSSASALTQGEYQAAAFASLLEHHAAPPARDRVDLGLLARFSMEGHAVRSSEEVVSAHLDLIESYRRTHFHQFKYLKAPFSIWRNRLCRQTLGEKITKKLSPGALRSNLLLCGLLRFDPKISIE